MPHLARRNLRPRARDLAESVSFLTRLPVRTGPPRGLASAWAWPLVGAGLGVMAGAAAWLAVGLGLNGGVAAALALAALPLLTGGLHEDGLADCADGFWGGRTRERRLEIMRDSRVGTYGVLALSLAMLLRWSALAPPMALGVPWGALAAACALGRVAPLLILRALPPARPTGLGAGAGRPAGITLALAAVLALAAGLAASGPAALVAAGAAVLATLVCGLVARAKIGGQTGDVCGAATVLAETAALLALA